MIGISQIGFLNFSGTERVKQNPKKLNHSKPHKLVSQSLFKQFNKSRTFFRFLTENLTKSLLLHIKLTLQKLK